MNFNKNLVKDFFSIGISYKKADALTRGLFSLSQDQLTSLLKNASDFEIDEVFVRRTAGYEEEIGRLKDELRVVRSQLQDKSGSFDTNSLGFSIAKANLDMQAEKERLAKIQKELLALSPQSSPPKPMSPADKDSSDPFSPSGGDVDTEAKAEEEHLTALTLK